MINCNDALISFEVEAIKSFFNGEFGFFQMINIIFNLEKTDELFYGKLLNKLSSHPYVFVYMVYMNNQDQQIQLNNKFLISVTQTFLDEKNIIYNDDTLTITAFQESIEVLLETMYNASEVM